MNEVQQIMTYPQKVTWHYVMDIHESEDYWYSVGLMRKEI